MAIIDLINGIFTGWFWVPVDNRLLTLYQIMMIGIFNSDIL